jgi:chorismate mutase
LKSKCTFIDSTNKVCREKKAQKSRKMENTKELGTWLDDMKLGHPLVIAGPCSAETEEQVLKIAHELKDSDVNYFRAGIWKPRTRPGMFEGVGAIGLKWLQKVKEETGMKTCTEVANAAHVKLALEHDVDLLWIGARSTVSPFIMQEIADALQGTDKVVLVKNPVNPDLALWLGGIERLYTAGIKNLGAIHRGFSTYEKSKYRNIPEWQLPIEFQNRFPDLPLICDPSHITGNRDMIFDVSQTALDLNFDGLMIETHTDPENAWSDAAQQVTPAALIQIMEDLKIRKMTNNESDYRESLNNLRAQINVVDAQLIEMMGKRMKVADKIGALKKEKNVAVLQSRRWNEILGNMILEGESNGLSEEFVLKMFKAIHQESINHQEKIIKA